MKRVPSSFLLLLKSILECSISKLIKTISDKIITEGYRSDKMQWDGLDDYGDRIGKGVYVYRLRVKTADGEYADKFEKLVILR